MNIAAGGGIIWRARLALHASARKRTKRRSEMSLEILTIGGHQSFPYYRHAGGEPKGDMIYVRRGPDGPWHCMIIGINGDLLIPEGFASPDPLEILKEK